MKNDQNTNNNVTNASGNNKKSNNRKKFNRRPSNSKVGSKDSRAAKYGKDLTTNDPAWYATNQQLLTDVASFPFAYPVGSTVNLKNPLFQSLSYKGKWVAPGITLFYVMPSAGYSNDAVSPLNVAAASVFSFVRHANSGARNYDDSDLMIYLLAMDQIYSYLNWLQRIYGLSDLFAQRNAYLNRAVLVSEGIDVDNIRSNYANFRAGINILIDKVSQFAVPATLPLFQRHAMMYSSIYTEGDSIKDQMYMYTPQAFWKFKLDDTGAGSLVAYDRPTNAATVQQLIAYGSDMIDRVLKIEDFGLFSGDILKAFGDGSLIKLREMPELWPVVPTPNIDVLEQMKNATVFPKHLVQGNTIQQSPNKDYLIHVPKLVMRQTESFDLPHCMTDYCKIKALSENRVLSTLRIAPTPSDVMEISRLMAGIEISTDTGTFADGDKTLIANIHCGSDYITYAEMIVLGVDGQSIEKFNVEYADTIVVGSTSSSAETIKDNLVRSMRANNVSSSFKFHPYECSIYVNLNESEFSLNVTDGIPNFDLDNYTILTDQNLDSLHEVAVLSLLGVKALGKL